MDAIIQGIIQKHLDEVKKKIAQKMSDYKRVASGKSIASLVSVATQEGGYIEGSKSFSVMEKGRRPGKVPQNFEKIIRDWVVAKGLSYDDLIPRGGSSEQGLRRLSGAIAHSIMTKGTKLYRDRGYNDIFSKVLEEEVEKLAEETAGIIELEVDKIIQMDEGDNEEI